MVRCGIFVGTLLLCAILSAVILYPNAKSYYTAWRDNGNLTAEYDAVQTRNQTIQMRVDDLNTPEGIEDCAREEFGWVKPGENAVNVTGVKVDGATSKLPETIVAGSTTMETNWLIDDLDAFFGYEYQR